tara:strand:+ start:676 stop:900 length:225 start_codon:yes stop_codon:yes gene_type:complete
MTDKVEVSLMSMEQVSKLLLRIPEVVAVTGYSRSFIYERIAEGELPVVRCGRTVRIRRDQLLDWIERQQACGIM